MKNYRLSGKLLIIVVVVIAVAVFAIYSASQQKLACLGCIVQYNGESIDFNSIRVSSPTSIVVGITNTGSLNLGLSSYYLKDSRGDWYWNQTWPGPTLSPRGSVTVDLSLTGSLSGQPFQFQSGQAYTIELVTARNNPFTYTFTA